MKSRQQSKTMTLQGENIDLGRSLNPTKKHPQVLLIIDEFLSLLGTLDNLGKTGKETRTKLTQILAQGRSLQVFVQGATQSATHDSLGAMRGNFANFIVLAQDSKYFNDLLLGDGASERGFDSTQLPPSSKANGYKHAGIGFMKEETGNPAKIRLAYSSDEALSKAIKPRLRTPKDTTQHELQRI